MTNAATAKIFGVVDGLPTDETPRLLEIPEAPLVRRDAVDDAHERAEGIVDDPACCFLLFLVEGFSGCLGDLAGEDLGGIFLLSGLLFLLGLLVRDLPRGFALSEFHLLFDGLLACGGELEELIHDEGCGDAGGGSGDDAAKDGGSFGSHISLGFEIKKV